MPYLISIQTYTVSNSVATLSRATTAINPTLLLRATQLLNVFYNNKPITLFQLSSLNGNVCITDMDGVKRLGIDIEGGGRENF